MEANTDEKLKIYRASAGSGKTWRLTVAFLQLILSDPMNYRHILAVTFTNKAAGEMRERAINELYKISRGKGDPAIMAEILKNHKTGKKTEQKAVEDIFKKAKIAIFLILHDYSHFRFQTIDTFFQTVLRNLARELGLGSHFNIDLDTEAAVDKAVDQLFEQASGHPDILEWIESYTFEHLENSGKRDIRHALKKFGKNIFNESFQERESSLRTLLKDKDFLKNYRKQLDGLFQQCFDELEEPLETYFGILDRHGLSTKDFSYAEKGVAEYFVKLRKACVEKNPDYLEDAYKKRAEEAYEDEDKWAPKTSPNRKTICTLAKEQLIPLLGQLEAKRREILPLLTTVQLIRQNLYKAGLLCDIADEVDQISRDNSRFLLSHTAPLLKAMIGENDAPFIFEKTGVDLHHMMIDEFQDTSHMQWGNFKPLLREGLANGYDSLIVGDTKQSIYRFRNGDWRILNGIDKELKSLNPVIEPLQVNRRSEINIIGFNNRCFHNGLEFISKIVVELAGKERMEEIRKAYHDVSQDYPEGKNSAGMVRNIFIRPDRERENAGETSSQKIVLQLLIQQVELLQEQGVKPEQIALLVRFNRDIPVIADYFASYYPKKPGICYQIISDEAFRLDSSLSVRILIAALRVLAEKNDGVHENSIPRNELRLLLNDEETYHTYLDICPQIRQLPLSDSIWEIYKIFNLQNIEGQDSYLFSLMDCLNDFCESESADLDEFLQHWEEHLYKRTIPLGGKAQGIRILSIHKSKGLQYHSVIVPFCDWTLCRYQGTLWCHTEEQPFGQLPLIPVEFTKRLAHSVFQESYREEVQQQVMDNLNILYVALTRAEKNLITISRCQKSHNGSAGLPDMTDILFQTATSGNILATEDNYQCFQFGELYVKEIGESIKENNKQSDIENIDIQFLNYRHKVGFRQSNRSREFIRTLGEEDGPQEETSPSPAQIESSQTTASPAGNPPHPASASSPSATASPAGNLTTSYIERGKLLHQLFSRIRRPEEAENAVRSLIGEGLLPLDRLDSTMRYVREALQDPIASQWWSGDYRLYNECTILSEDEDGHIVGKRPDRVVERDGRIQVIDFKFGQHRPSYVEQVRGYMNLLAEMGHQDVEGYLWYVDQHEIRQVKRHECVILPTLTSGKQ